MTRGSAKPDTFEPGALERHADAWTHPGSPTAMLNDDRARRERPRSGELARLKPSTLILRAGDDSVLERHVAEAGLALCDDGRPAFVEDPSQWLRLEQPARINEHLIESLCGG